jgi:protein-L-isoaspartate(D-aspartate) O-methyltransferase
VPELARSARALLDRLGASNVHVIEADGSLGWPAAAPYQAIVVAAAAPEVPAPLVEQLDEGGRLVVPVGDDVGQSLIRVRRLGRQTHTEFLTWCAFVPLVGEHGRQ